jgi:choline dehydrogenase-like flavoprotein
MSPQLPSTAPAGQDFDLIVIGSGPGGAMAAWPAVQAGRRVLMIERGDWVHRRPENWGPAGFVELTPAWATDTAYQVLAGGTGPLLGVLATVGGASVFYGGVAIRMRESDFAPDPDIDADSGAAWPYTYADLEPYYSRGEQLLDVAGVTGEDPTEPWRSTPYPQQLPELAPVSARLAEAARALGLHPSRLPLAINFRPSSGRNTCIRCGTCDGFACAIEAKNDVATRLIAPMVHAGLELAVNTVAVELTVSGRRVTDVVCADRWTGARRRFRGRHVIVAAGALATPHLILASDLTRLNPAGHLVGRHLMRHCNAVVMGGFPQRPAPAGEFHKQIAIQDYYFGHDSVQTPRGRLGGIQQFGTPQLDYVRRYVPRWMRPLVTTLVPHTTGFIVMAEDRPQAANRVGIDRLVTTRYGMPEANVTHRYDARDLGARRALVGFARRVLKQAGAKLSYAQDITTFSHAVGTVRMGDDPARAPLDAWGAFRGLDNLSVADGSVFPRSSGVNPSLTIAANALRTGERVATFL